MLGSMLHREERAEILASFTEALLAAAKKPDASPRVVCARGADGLTLAEPGTDLAETFARAGWQLVAPLGQEPSRQATLDDIRAIDPDVIVFTDPAMRATLTQSEAWRSLRAVRDGHAVVAPNVPFGWLDEPPSINRLLGLAWLGGAEPRSLAALFNAVVYGRALTAPQLDALVARAHSLQP
jgi:iron complex transport system substrate-binding protein